MSTVVVFHHAQGLTPGVLDFSAALRSGGHAVHTPDMYEGRTFDDLDEGVAHLQAVGFTELGRRALDAIADLPADVVYVGMSMGTNLTEVALMSRPGARAAVLLYGGLSPDLLEVPALRALPVQAHYSEHDPWIDDYTERVVRELGGEVFVYPGSGHLLADPISPDYDPVAADQILGRVIAFLDALV